MIFSRFKSWLTSLLTGDCLRKDQSKTRYSILEMDLSPTGSDDSQASSVDTYYSLSCHNHLPFNCMCSPSQRTLPDLSPLGCSTVPGSARSKRKKPKKSKKSNDASRTGSRNRKSTVESSRIPQSPAASDLSLESFNNPDSESEKDWTLVSHPKRRYKAKNSEKPTTHLTSPKSSSVAVPGLELSDVIGPVVFSPVSSSSQKATLSRRESSTRSSTESFSTTFSSLEHFSTTPSNTERSSTAASNTESSLTVHPDRESSLTALSDTGGNSPAFSNEISTTIPTRESTSTDFSNRESSDTLPDMEYLKLGVNTSSSARAQNRQSFDSADSNEDGSCAEVSYLKNFKTEDKSLKTSYAKSPNLKKAIAASSAEIPLTVSCSKNSKFTSQKNSSTPSINHKRSTNQNYSGGKIAYFPHYDDRVQNPAHSGPSLTNPSGIWSRVQDSSLSDFGNRSLDEVENSDDSMLTGGTTSHQRKQKNLSVPLTGHGKTHYSEVVKKSLPDSRPDNTELPNFQETDSSPSKTNEIPSGTNDCLPRTLECYSPLLRKYSETFDEDPDDWNSTGNENSFATSVNTPVCSTISLSGASSIAPAAASTPAIDSSILSNSGEGWNAFNSVDSVWDSRISTPPAVNPSSDSELLVSEGTSPKVRLSPIGEHRRNRRVRSVDSDLLPKQPNDRACRVEPENPNLSFSSLPSLNISLFKQPSADDWLKSSSRTSFSPRNSSDSFSANRSCGVNAVSRRSGSSVLNELRKTSTPPSEYIKNRQLPNYYTKKDCIGSRHRVSTERDPRCQVADADPEGHVTAHEGHQGQVSAYAHSKGQASMWGGLHGQVSEYEHSQSKGAKYEDVPNKDFSSQYPLTSENENSKDAYPDSHLSTEEVSNSPEEKILSQSFERANTHFSSQECGSSASDLQGLCYSISDQENPNDINSNPQDVGTAYDKPKERGTVYDELQERETAHHEPQERGATYDESQCPGTAYDEPQERGVAYDEPQCPETAYRDSRRQFVYVDPQGQVSAYGGLQSHIVYTDPQGQVSGYAQPRQQIAYGDLQDQVSVYGNSQVQVSAYAQPQGQSFAWGYSQTQDTACGNAANQDRSCPVLLDSQYLYAVFQRPNCRCPGHVDSHNICTNSSWPSFSHSIPPNTKHVSMESKEYPEHSSQDYDSRGTHLTSTLITCQPESSQTLPNQYATEYTFQQSTTMNTSSIENQVTHIAHSVNTVNQLSPYIAINEPLANLSIARTTPYENLPNSEQNAHSTRGRNTNHRASEQHGLNNSIHEEHIPIQSSYGLWHSPIRSSCEQPPDPIQSPYGQLHDTIQSPSSQPSASIQWSYEQQPGPIWSPYGQPSGLTQSSYGQSLDSIQSLYGQPPSQTRGPYVQQFGLNQAHSFNHPGSNQFPHRQPRPN